MCKAIISFSSFTKQQTRVAEKILCGRFESQQSWDISVWMIVFISFLKCFSFSFLSRVLRISSKESLDNFSGKYFWEFHGRTAQLQDRRWRCKHQLKRARRSLHRPKRRHIKCCRLVCDTQQRHHGVYCLICVYILFLLLKSNTYLTSLYYITWVGVVIV